VNTGYSGRVAIYEILVMNEMVRQMILKDPNETNIQNAAISSGMKTLRVAALQKAAQQLTSLEEVYRVTHIEEE
jgi:type II secretory ATPase GspE/PulE/Tfp pilus assembly ATPase PilB-like protein